MIINTDEVDRHEVHLGLHEAQVGRDEVAHGVEGHAVQDHAVQVGPVEVAHEAEGHAVRVGPEEVAHGAEGRVDLGEVDHDGVDHASSPSSFYYYYASPLLVGKLTVGTWEGLGGSIYRALRRAEIFKHDSCVPYQPFKASFLKTAFSLAVPSRAPCPNSTYVFSAKLPFHISVFELGSR